MDAVVAIPSSSSSLSSSSSGRLRLAPPLRPSPIHPPTRLNRPPPPPSSSPSSGAACVGATASSSSSLSTPRSEPTPPPPRRHPSDFITFCMGVASRTPSPLSSSSSSPPPSSLKSPPPPRRRREVSRDSVESCVDPGTELAALRRLSSPATSRANCLSSGSMVNVSARAGSDSRVSLCTPSSPSSAIASRAKIMASKNAVFSPCFARNASHS
mmetsp:Transcript_6761/g.27520  ORF Transcript_6761/g.27520 Transcript_6761/m.27520 type:complete len:213 (-) Transcript_6761:8169-8807(-)